MSISISFVLVRPRDPNNIGASARAMANFGFTTLRVVAPYAPIWKETKAAVHAESVILKAKTYSTLAGAISGSHRVVGTSAGTSRLINSKWIDTDAFQSLLKKRRQGKKTISIVFGSEKHGLTNEDFAECDAILRLPTVATCPSMNLAQSVSIVAYLVYQSLRDKKSGPLQRVEEEFQREDRDRLVQNGMASFQQAALFKQWTPQKMERELRDWMARSRPTKKEQAILYGIFRRLNQLAKPTSTGR